MSDEDTLIFGGGGDDPTLINGFIGGYQPGPQGPQGDQGPKGDTGPEGPSLAIGLPSAYVAYLQGLGFGPDDYLNPGSFHSWCPYNFPGGFAFQSGFSATEFYFRREGRIARFRGMISRSGAAGALIATLPQGFRPMDVGGVGNAEFPVLMMQAGQPFSDPLYPTRLRITSAGDMAFYGAAPSTANLIIGMEGVGYVCGDPIA